MSTTAATAKAKAMALIPTLDEAKKAGSEVGGVALGIMASHAVINLIKKQDSLLVNGAVFAGGAIGAMKVKNPFFKALCVGACVYGGLKLINKATAAVSTPGATEGLAGMLPESVKSALRKFVPTFAGIDEVSGLGNTDDMEGLSLDDQGNGESMNRDEDLNGRFSRRFMEQSTEGVGNILDNAA